MERITIPKTSQHPEYILEYDEHLKRTGMDYPKSLRGFGKGFMVSSSEDEMRILLELKERGQDPRGAAAYADIFHRNDYCAWQWTRTWLKVPKGWENGRYQTNATGDREYPRIAIDGERETDTVLVPEGHGRVIVDWHENGIPRITRLPNPLQETCFYCWRFSEQGNSAVALTAEGPYNQGWHLCFDARYWRSGGVDFDYAFRPVKIILTDEEKNLRSGQISLADAIGGEFSIAEDSGKLTLS